MVANGTMTRTMMMMMTSSTCRKEEVVSILTKPTMFTWTWTWKDFLESFAMLAIAILSSSDAKSIPPISPPPPHPHPHPHPRRRGVADLSQRSNLTTTALFAMKMWGGDIATVAPIARSEFIPLASGRSISMTLNIPTP